MTEEQTRVESRVKESHINARVPFSFSQQMEFTLKELRETLRDRRTTVTLMVMPLLLYPLLGLGLRFIALPSSGTQQYAYRLAFETEEEAMWVSEALQTTDPDLAAVEKPEGTPELQLLVPDDDKDFDLEQMVMQTTADLGIKVEFKESNEAVQREASVELLQNDGSALSAEVALFVEQHLAAANIEWIKRWANQNGQSLPIPIEQSRTMLTPAETGSAILGLLPLILLLMTVTGGVYPAIDLTAGERERNTMEALMALPVPKFRLLAAKYVAVVVVTMLTGLMNLLAMSLTLFALQLDKSLLGENGFTLALGLKLFFALNVFAFFYSAVLLLLTSSARSFKEAQAYLIPLLLLSLAPGMVILLPGWSLGFGTAVIPLVNVLLLTRELLEGSVPQLPATAAFISTILYGAAALSFAARVFGNDAVAVGSRGLWKDLIERPKEQVQLPSLSAALSTLALMFPAYFIASGIMSRGEEGQPANRLVISAVLTIVLFIGVPWLLLRWLRVSPTEGSGWKKAKWNYWIAATLFGLGTWPLVFELVILAQSLGIRGFDPSQIENVDELLAGWKEVPNWLIVICLGIVPGVCEEFFFRGYLLNGLKRSLTAFGTVAVSALAFGFFHVVLAGAASPERLLPSTLMGFLLGSVAYRSQSVIPSMMLHAIHNSLLLMIVQSKDLLESWNIGQLNQEHLPWWLLVISVGLLLGGTLFLQISRSRTQPSESSE